MSRRSRAYGLEPDPPFPRGHIAGLTYSHTGGNVISITAGECRLGNSTRRSQLNFLTQSTFTKAMDSTWAAGTGNGGMASTAHPIAADDHYHLFAVYANGAPDFIADDDIDGSGVIADTGSRAFRRIGSILTGGGAAILSMIQIGDTFWFAEPQTVITLAAGTQLPTATDSDVSLAKVPVDVKVLAHILYRTPNATTDTLHITAGSGTIGANGADAAAPLNMVTAAGAASSFQMTVPTDTSGRVVIRMTDATNDLRIQTLGYTDFRGRYD